MDFNTFKSKSDIYEFEIVFKKYILLRVHLNVILKKNCNQIIRPFNKEIKFLKKIKQ